jgi:hypothetical protein
MGLSLSALGLIDGDVARICGRFSKPTTISVARRDAVARLDAYVGPKY